MSGFYFQWQNNQGSWVMFDDLASWKIENEKRFGVQMQLDIPPQSYVLDFQAMTQTNQKTGMVRPIRQSQQQHQLLGAPRPPPPPPQAGLFAAAGAGGLFGGGFGGASHKRRGAFPFGMFSNQGNTTTDSMFPNSDEQVVVEETIEYKDLIDCAHPISRWWDQTLMPTACKNAMFSYGCAVVPSGSKEWQAIFTDFQRCNSNNSQLLCVWRIQNHRLLQKWNTYYQQLRQDMTTDAQHRGSQPSERPSPTLRTVFHGCGSPENINSIAHSGYDVLYSSSDDSINAWGHGIYFGASPEVSMRYCCDAPKELRAVGAPMGSKIMLLSVLTTADLTLGERALLKPAFIRGSKSGRRYDTFCNKMGEEPTILVATDNAQAYPAYILSVK